MMEEVREVISKGAFQYEVKALSRDDRQALLEQAKISDAISPNNILALKVDLSIPWNKLRFLRRYRYIQVYTNKLTYALHHRWMSGWNIQLGSERRMRSLANELIGSNLASEMVAFTYSLAEGREELCKAPMAYVPDLTEKVRQLLDQNDR